MSSWRWTETSVDGAALKVASPYTEDGAALKVASPYTEDRAALKVASPYTEDGAALKVVSSSLDLCELGLMRAWTYASLDLCELGLMQAWTYASLGSSSSRAAGDRRVLRDSAHRETRETAACRGIQLI